MSATLLHAPPPLRLPLSIDEDLRGAQFLQEFLLDVFGLDPSLFFLPENDTQRRQRTHCKIAFDFIIA